MHILKKQIFIGNTDDSSQFKKKYTVQNTVLTFALLCAAIGNCCLQQVWFEKDYSLPLIFINELGCSKKAACLFPRHPDSQNNYTETILFSIMFDQ